jgi:hypothetical protein
MWLTITLILAATIALAALEIFLFWRLGERAERRRIHDPERTRSSEVRTGLVHTYPRRRTASPAKRAA